MACNNPTCPQCYPTFTNIYNAKLNSPEIKAKGAMVGGYSGALKGSLIGGAIAGPPGVLIGIVAGAIAGGNAGYKKPRSAALGLFNLFLDVGQGKVR